MQKKIVPPKWTPLPSVEEMLARRAAYGNNPNANMGGNAPAGQKNAAMVMNTPAQSSQLNAGQQQLFGGFSCTADSHLNS